MSNMAQDDQVILLDYDEDKRRYNDQIDEAKIVKSSRIIWIFVLLLISLIVWAYNAPLVEVSRGTGKVEIGRAHV